MQCLHFCCACVDVPYFIKIKLLFAETLFILLQTYCNDRTTPDSASTATALLCGVKTNYGTLGVKDNAGLGNCSSQFGNEAESILDWFHADGKISLAIATSRRFPAELGSNGCFRALPESPEKLQLVSADSDSPLMM